MNGDGLPDFIVGKRYMSHFGIPTRSLWCTRAVHLPYRAESTARRAEPSSCLSWFTIAPVRDPTSSLMDINKDGATDIVTSSTHGTYIFWGSAKAVRSQAPAK